ncbi:TetR/AcrR family transcriptional regulator [Aeromicrobium sp.]|jgi:AcrR family transcriptional regulator|uniref:TetR/AcrR family transcriptional regulator n=1 Tax=Aeromicrobium sp. TaxID=1871063 RepID=UPI003C4DED6E
MASTAKVRPGKVIRAARKSTRRQDYSSSTKRALLENAAQLFTDHGYAGTSLDEVVAAARVTKGALYHHFPSKLALFESVFNGLQETTTKEIEKKVNRIKDPWERAAVGLRAFLDACREPHFRRIVLQEGPVALGHERWTEAERAASLGIVQRTVDALLKDLGGAEELSESFAIVFYGAIRSASEYVADAEDPETASREVQATIGAILAGMRLLPSIGLEVEDAAETIEPQ